MKKIFTAALVAVFSCALFGQSSGGRRGGGGGTVTPQWSNTNVSTPTTPNSVSQILTCTPSAGSCTPGFNLSGVVPNAQTGTTYTVAATDRLGYLTFSNAAAVAVSLPSAASFGSNFAFLACDIGTGTATITPATSTISYSNGVAYTSGASSLALTTGQCAWVYSDNTNYFAVLAISSSLPIHGNITSTGITNTGTTSETWLADVAVPANLPANTLITVRLDMHNPTGNAGTCKIIARYGATAGSVSGTFFGTTTVSTTNYGRLEGEVKYRNSTSAQWVLGTAWTGSGSSTSAGNSGTTVNTTSTSYIAITMTNSVAADTCYFDSGDYWIWKQ